MAKSPARKASPKKGKSAAKSAKRAAPKGSAKRVPVKGRKAPKPAKASKSKMAKSSKAAKKAAPRKVAKPKHDAAHAHHMEEVRAQVARRRPGMGAANIPHEHQDPSIIAPPAPPPAPVDQLHGNYGDAKARSVARNDNPTNWFRQAPKPKSK